MSQECKHERRPFTGATGSTYEKCIHCGDLGPVLTSPEPKKRWEPQDPNLMSAPLRCAAHKFVLPCQLCITDYSVMTATEVQERQRHFPAVAEAADQAIIDRIAAGYYDTKATNPKDAIGSTKLDMGLVPSSAIAYMALGFTEGALKYGRYNWRLAGVRASIYIAAAARHTFKWWNGERADPKTRVPHLASAMCCLAIILDADLCEKLTDDRPPACKGFSKFIDDLEHDVKQMIELFTSHNPKQYTIEDTEI